MACIVNPPQDDIEPNISNSILWPPQGGLIRIWSIISRQNDGFWQVKKKQSNGNFLLDGKGRYDDRSLFRMYTIRSPEEEFIPGDDETPCWIGIPGNHIGGKADKNLIYMLEWTVDNKGNKIVVAKGYPLPSEIFEPPQVPEDERINLSFLVKFDYNKGCYIIHDFDQWMKRPETKYFYVKTNGKGITSREKLVRDENLTGSQSRYYNDPGLMYYINSYGI
uniref:Uncharacterized protein LOC102805864 n=1 Tax=Saccoglossus kowalevskii TaxID=10224 RepID=A0ABM0MR59_SACKO|nr:PREDICTED: uncharacterized protein LOC102805864 [Saccoglossus kowalevskii]